MNKYKLESLFFLFFGLFHIHRIWAFIDSKSYNNFWLGLLGNRGPSFFFLGILLIIVSIIVILYFLKNYKAKKWWRWIYLLGGIYVSIDSILNLLNNNFIKNVVIKMYTVEQSYYYILWGLFILLGMVCIIICIYLWNYNDSK
jgi:uncharacterized membrane protein